MMNHYKLKIFIGFLIFLSILYNRIFRIREEKVFFITFDLFIFLLYTTLAATMLCLCAYNCIIIYRWVSAVELKPNTNPIILFIRENATKHIQNTLGHFRDSLETFDSYLKNNTPYYNDEKRYTDILCEIFGQWLEKYAKISTFLELSIIALCQLVVVTGFVFDLLYLGKFSYFYKYLWLLIIPLVIQYIIYSINIYAKINLEALNNIIHIHVITHEELQKPLKLADIPRISLEQHHILAKAPVQDIFYIKTISAQYLKENPGMDIIITLQKYLPDSSILCKLLFYTETFYESKTKYLALFNSLRYFSYGIGWLYLAFLLCL